MKTLLTILIFMLQALFNSASAMSEKPIHVDSTSEERKIIVLKDGTEIKGKILTQKNDTINVIINDDFSVKIPTKEISKIYDINYFAKNIIYIDAASFLFTGYISLNYERMIEEHFSMRAGYGYGYFLDIDLGGGGDNEYMNGINFSLNLFIGKKNSKFEIDGGISYTWIQMRNHKSEKIYPVFAIDYRYQPKYGGFVFRVGTGMMLGCFGFNLSLSYVL